MQVCSDKWNTNIKIFRGRAKQCQAAHIPANWNNWGKNVPMISYLELGSEGFFPLSVSYAATVIMS